MIRGTTPTVYFALDGIVESDIKELYITIRQGSTSVTKTDYKSEDGVYYVKLTQEETLSFMDGAIYCQIKILTTDGNVVATPIRVLRMNDILMEEVI